MRRGAPPWRCTHTGVPKSHPRGTWNEPRLVQRSRASRVPRWLAGHLPLTTGREAHHRGVEVDVRRRLLGADGVAGELVLVAGPRPVADLLFEPRLDERFELGGRAPDTIAQLRGAPILGGSEHRRR